jgi:hypothetical protein
MTEYTDLPTASVLYSESERNQVAVDNIDAGGMLTMFIIGAPPPAMTMQVPGLVTAPAPPPMPVQITIDPNSPPSAAFMADLRAWLVTRQDDLNNQLAALEVTNTPAPIGPPTTRK